MLVLAKSVCIRDKVVLFGHIGCIPAKWFYSGKMDLFGQSGCNWATLLYLSKNCLNRIKWLYSEKVVIFG